MSDELLAELAIRTQKDRAEEFVATVVATSPLEVRWRGEQMGAVNGLADSMLIVGDTVRVVRFSTGLVVYAKQSALPVLGVVSAYTSTSPNVTVVAGDDTFDAQIGQDGWTPAVGHRVWISWTSKGPFAMKRGGTVASPADPPLPPDNMNATSGPDLPAPKPPAASGSPAVIYAQQTASYQSGALYTGAQGRYWLYAGNDSSSFSAFDGFWFYGDQTAKIRGVTVTKFEVWLQRATSVGPSTAANVPLVMHTGKTRTSTEPTVSSPTYYFDTLSLKPGQSGWFTLPTSWGQFIAGGAYAGLAVITLYGTDPLKALYGIDHPNAAYRSTLSGAMRFTYKRS